MANSKQYEWNDISVNILGRNVKGLLGLEYNIKTEKKPLYGRGNKPLSIQSGNKSYDGQITLLKSEFDAMLDAVKAVDRNNDLTDISFDIVWCFARGTTIHTSIILGVEIEDYGNAMKQGDSMMEIKLKFKALDVQEKA
jgi:hypothetical protein